jgi:hypothetical protein
LVYFLFLFPLWYFKRKYTKEEIRKVNIPKRKSEKLIYQRGNQKRKYTKEEIRKEKIPKRKTEK